MCIKKAPKSQKINLLGAVEAGSGEIVVEEVEGNTTHAEVFSFLEKLGEDATKECPVFVLLDQASYHTHKKILEERMVWAKRHFYVFYLPTYSPHLNDMERVWKHLKYHLLRRRFYKNVTELRQDVFSKLKEFFYSSSVPSVDELLAKELYAA